MEVAPIKVQLDNIFFQKHNRTNTEQIGHQQPNQIQRVTLKNHNFYINIIF